MVHQATAPLSRPFGVEAFTATNTTVLRWLGMAGFLVNSRGTALMIDPLLTGFDMPLLIEFPITTADVPKLDGVLITHSDNDHYSAPTCRELTAVTDTYHSTPYVASLISDQGLPGHGHAIGEEFDVGTVRVRLTPADHAWQNQTPGASPRHFEPEDCCGFWIDTSDGTIWAPGDSWLIRDHHLLMPAPDALLFDFSDSEWHFGLDGAIEMANAYPDTPSCCTTMAASMHPTFPRSTPTPPP